MSIRAVHVEAEEHDTNQLFEGLSMELWRMARRYVWEPASAANYDALVAAALACHATDTEPQPCEVVESYVADHSSYDYE
jgi:hypothetical protein